MSDAAPARLNNGPNDTSGSAPVGRGRRVLRMLALMGPAFIVGAWQFGPGNLTSAVQAGSRFGYSLIWVIAVSTVLMLIYADMSIRIALVSKGSVVQTIKEHLGRWVGGLAGFGVFAITLMFSVGNAVGSGLGLSLVFGGSPMWWTLACTTVVVGILFARRLYTLIEKLVLVIVAVMAASFVATAIVTRPDWGAAAVGSVVPVVPAGVGLLIVALVGTNFSVNAAFYAGYASRERGLRRQQYRETTIADTIPGIVAPDQRIYEGSEYLGRAINTPAIYSASKAGLWGLTQYLASYWGGQGVRVNAITPGGVFSGQNETFVRNYSQRVPLGRMGKPAEVAAAVRLLVSDQGAFINGQMIQVNGGAET